MVFTMIPKLLFSIFLTTFIVKETHAFISLGFPASFCGRYDDTCLALSASFAEPIPNEFSRPLNTDRILKTSAGKQRRGYRDFQIAVEAEDVECAALATRFDLKNIESLKADLSISAPYTGGGSGTALTVQVDGKIMAKVTRTCVRTNEDFQVDLEIPISSIVKPVANNFNVDDFLDQQQDNENSQRKKQTKSNRKKNLRADRIHNMNDMMELQQMINQYEEDETFTGEGEIVEDESIYSMDTGALDVGELVAQAFWLNLDPYPKKPGSGPVEFSISG